jgi:hypothetical protein
LAAGAAALRQAAWRLIALWTVSGRRREEDGLAELVIAVVAVVAEIAAWHDDGPGSRRSGRD